MWHPRTNTCEAGHTINNEIVSPGISIAERIEQLLRQLPRRIKIARPMFPIELRVLQSHLADRVSQLINNNRGHDVSPLPLPLRRVLLRNRDAMVVTFLLPDWR